jgi:hypothetical protein
MKTNGYLITGSSNSFSSKGDSDAYCIRLSKEGKMLWSKVYGTSLEEFETKCWGTRDSGFIIAFEALKKSGKDTCIFVVKCDKNGNMQWSKSIKNTEVEINIPQYIYQSKKGDYYLLNERVEGFKNDHFSLIKLNSSGDLQWGKSINSKALSDFVTVNLAETNNGNIIASGYSLGDNFNTYGSYIILYVFDEANGNIKQCKKICTANCNMFTDLRPDNLYVNNDSIFINGLYSPENRVFYTCWFSFKMSDTQVKANYNLLRQNNSIQYLINKKFIKQPGEGYRYDLLFTDDGGYISASYPGDITINKYDSLGGICISSTIPSIDTSIYKTIFFIYDKSYEVLDDTITATNAIIKTKDVAGQKTTCFSNGTTQPKILTETNVALFSSNNATLNVYPNPAKDFVTVKFQLSQPSLHQLKIFSVDGKCISTKRFQLNKNDSSVKLDIKSLSPGLYYIQVDGLEKLTVIKFIKNNN